MAGVSARRAPTTPRPSISPLSTTSRTRLASPNAADSIAKRRMNAYENTEVERTTDAEIGGQHDDRSSSLSDPDDEHDGSEERDGVDEELVDGHTLAAQRSLEVDSEAETERLDQTPQKLNKHPDNLGRTPSKLSQAATADEELSEPPSPVPAGAGAASSTSTVATAGQKRKRSDTADSSLTSADSDTGESPRKRKHESTTNGPMDDSGAIVDAAQTEDAAERAENTPTLEEARETLQIPIKGPKGRKGKPKGKKLKEQLEETESVVVGEPAETIEEPSEEDPVKTEEQRKFKKEASSQHDGVTKQFRAFKEKLYTERLKALDAELQLLSQPSSIHPEFARQVACIDARLQKQTKEANAYYNYRLRCIRQRTLGERSQMHSQYFQHVRHIREEKLYSLGEEWYAIQRERRQSHQDKDDAYVYKFPGKKSVQLRQQAKYNQEVSVLSGVAKFVGFPAAPEIVGTEGEGLEEDLRAMKISRRVVQPPAPTAAAAAPARQVYLPAPTTATFTQNERLAHEQYLEQNPWARPQASIHAHGTPGISHTPDWAEQPAAGTHTTSTKFVRNMSGQNIDQRHSSPFATPIPQQKQVAQQQQQQPSSGFATVGVNSDSFTENENEIAPPSSVLATAGGTPQFPSNQMGEDGSGGGSAQVSPLTFAKARENGADYGGGDGFRNISGISGVSTIDAPDLISENPTTATTTTTTTTAIMGERPPPPHLPTEESSNAGGYQVFDTSQLHRHPEDRSREVYASVGGFMRPVEGAFGTPAPLGGPAPAPAPAGGGLENGGGGGGG